MNTNITSLTTRINNVDWKFLGMFTLYLGILVGLVQILQTLYEDASRFTAWTVATFWKLFMVPVTSSGTHVTFYDFTMEIIFECTGLHYAAIFASAIFAFQGRSMANKAIGLFAGIGLIFGVNVLRLGMLGMVGHYNVSLFSFMHLSVWHALFTFFVLFFWIIWVNGKLDLSWLLTQQVVTAVLVASFAFWFMYTYLHYYFVLLAYVANNVFGLLSTVLNVPSAVIVKGYLIGYVSGEYTTYSKTGLYTLNFAVYIGLAAANISSTGYKLCMKRFMLGTGIMILFHLCLLCMDWTLETTADSTLLAVLTWSMVLSSMIAPVVSWLAASLVFRSSGKP